MRSKTLCVCLVTLLSCQDDTEVEDQRSKRQLSWSSLSASLVSNLLSGPDAMFQHMGLKGPTPIAQVFGRRVNIQGQSVKINHPLPSFVTITNATISGSKKTATYDALYMSCRNPSCKSEIITKNYKRFTEQGSVYLADSNNVSHIAIDVPALTKFSLQNATPGGGSAPGAGSSGGTTSGGADTNVPPPGSVDNEGRQDYLRAEWCYKKVIGNEGIACLIETSPDGITNPDTDQHHPGMWSPEQVSDCGCDLGDWSKPFEPTKTPRPIIYCHDDEPPITISPVPGKGTPKFGFKDENDGDCMVDISIKDKIPTVVPPDLTDGCFAGGSCHQASDKVYYPPSEGGKLKPPRYQPITTIPQLFK